MLVYVSLLQIISFTLRMIRTCVMRVTSMLYFSCTLYCLNTRVGESVTHNQIQVLLRKHTYSHMLKILPPKSENFQIKHSDIFHVSAQNIDCGYSLELPRRGGSSVYLQSMFLSRNKKNNAYPWKPQFYFVEVGFKGVKIV